MPELPEVETVVGGLRAAVIGRRVVSFTSSWPRQIVGMDANTFADRLVGQTISRLERRAKYLVFSMSSDYLLIHLKMSGRLYITQKEHEAQIDRWIRAVFGFDDESSMCFSDLRKFGRLYLTEDVEQITGRLGPEPLATDFSVEWFASRLARRKGPIKGVLLDQTVAAGVGNIYADEALWRARIDPNRAATALNEAEIKALHSGIGAALQQGISHEGASINWYRKADGSRGDEQNHFNVYGQQGKPCRRCGSPIVKMRLGQRGTHYCPKCQT